MTTATPSDQAAFLARICAEPDCNAHRVVYADWLDEQDDERVTCPKCGGNGKVEGLWPHRSENLHAGDCRECHGIGTVLNTSRRDRAEFIRIQVELAVRYCCLNHQEASLLLSRESALRNAHLEWLACPCPECVGHTARSGTRHCPFCGGTGDLMKHSLAGQSPSCHAVRPHRFARGFLESVTLPFTGSNAPPACRGRPACRSGRPAAAGRAFEQNPALLLPALYGTTVWRSTRLARGLLAHFGTITEVELEGREPLDEGGQHYWWYDTRGNPPYLSGTAHHIPPPVWDMLEGGQRIADSRHCISYRAADDARRACWRAAARVIRRELAEERT